MAQNRAPGLLREADSFAFVHLADAPLDVWKDLRAEATAVANYAPSTWIRATDIEGDALTCTLQNARRARVEKLIYLKACDFRVSPIPSAPGLIVMNPPYGERIGDPAALPRLYSAVGDWLKHSCTGLRAAILTADPPLAKSLRLKPSRKIPLFNGPIECRLLLFDLYSGTHDARLLAKHT